MLFFYLQNIISVMALRQSCLYNAPHFFRRDWLLDNRSTEFIESRSWPSPTVSPVMKINRFARAGHSLCSRRSNAGPSRSGILTSLTTGDAHD